MLPAFHGNENAAIERPEDIVVLQEWWEVKVREKLNVLRIITKVGDLWHIIWDTQDEFIWWPKEQRMERKQEKWLEYVRTDNQRRKMSFAVSTIFIVSSQHFSVRAFSKYTTELWNTQCLFCRIMTSYFWHAVYN